MYFRNFRRSVLVRNLLHQGFSMMKISRQWEEEARSSPGEGSHHQRHTHRPHRPAGTNHSEEYTMRSGGWKRFVTLWKTISYNPGDRSHVLVMLSNPNTRILMLSKINCSWTWILQNQQSWVHSRHCIWYSFVDVKTILFFSEKLFQTLLCILSIKKR